MNLVLTILLAAVLMGLVVAVLSIGLIVTGKSRLRRGCGKIPRKGEPTSSEECSLCGDKKACNQDEPDADSDTRH